MLRETKDKVAEENKGYLGISGINVTSDVANMYGMPQGVYVTQVYEGTAAADAGMLNGDIITGFEGSGVGSMEDVQVLRELGRGRLDVTIGSALDLFGGCIPYENVVYL